MLRGFCGVPAEAVGPVGASKAAGPAPRSWAGSATGRVLRKGGRGKGEGEGGKEGGPQKNLEESLKPGEAQGRRRQRRRCGGCQEERQRREREATANAVEDQSAAKNEEADTTRRSALDARVRRKESKANAEGTCRSGPACEPGTRRPETSCREESFKNCKTWISCTRSPYKDSGLLVRPSRAIAASVSSGKPGLLSWRGPALRGI